MKDLLVGVDASTTAVKAIVFDRDGAIVSEGRHPIGLANPESDGWEQDAEEWWSAFERAVARAISSLTPEQVGAVRAIAVANQRETFVLVDAAGKPLHPALVWMDARCRPEVTAATRALGAERLHELTGKPACVTPSFYKAAYLLTRKAPELRAAAPRLLDVHAFLALRMTGELVTSIAAADPLGLSSITTLDWAEPLLAYLGLTRESVPRLVAPGAVMGTLTPEAARRLKLPAGLPVVAGAGDGQAAGLGAGITTGDRAYMNLGTAIVSGVLSHAPRLDRAFRTLAGAVPGTFFLETDLKGGLFTVGWLIDKWLGRGRRTSDEEIIRELDREARALRPGSGGLVVVPYWNGVMNPYWDDDATGIVMGFRGDHGPAHMYRAILEGIAFEERLHSRAVETATGTPLRELVVMGGAAQSDLFCQILADVLERPIVRAGTHEATALGAAMLAAIGTAVHASADDAARVMTRVGATFTPGPASPAYARLFDEVYAGLFPEVRARMARLRELA